MEHKRKVLNPFNTKSRTEVYNEAYVAGYNQARVDIGLMSQTEADKILRKL